MIRKLERIAEISIVGALILFTLIIFRDHSVESNLNMITEFILWIGLYVVQVKWIIPIYLKGRSSKYLLISILILIVSIIIGVFINAVHLEEMNYRRYYSSIPFLDYIKHIEWWQFKDTILGILILFISSTVYGLLRNIKFPEKTGFKKVLPISFFSIIILIVAGFISLVFIENFKEYPQMDYKTRTSNEKIIFIEPADTLITFSNIVNHENPICVLFWAQSCGSQRDNVIRLNDIKKKLTKKRIDFIYICGEYVRENDKKIWKDFIISEEIEGCNIYLNREQFHNIFIDGLGLQDGLQDKNLFLISSSQEIIYKLSFSSENENDLIEKINKL